MSLPPIPPTAAPQKYVPSTKKLVKRPPPPTLPIVATPPPPASAVFIAANNASAMLIKRTGQSELAAFMMAENKKLYNTPVAAAASAAASTKQRKLAAPTKQSLPPIPPTSTAPLALPVSQQMVAVDPKDALKSAHSLEQHKRRDDELALFAVATIQRPHQRPTNDMIIQTPPVVGVLQYCAKFKDSDAWYKPMSMAIASHPELSFPDTPLMTRDVLMTFMREPDPRATYERPCFNLDRNPHEHEGRVRCIAHVLSERIWGKERAFRLRELLFEHQNIKINAALEAAAAVKGAAKVQDPRDFLSPVAEMCYMCHVWMTTEACLNQKNRLAKDPSDDDDIVILNRFVFYGCSSLRMLILPAGSWSTLTRLAR
jgi:hypothetical protein